MLGKGIQFGEVKERTTELIPSEQRYLKVEMVLAMRPGRKSIPSRGHSNCKAPEAEVCSPCLKDHRKPV